MEGAPIPRPFVVAACLRRAYREAKKVFKGRPLSILEPQASNEKPFHAKVVDSMREFKNAPS